MRALLPVVLFALVYTGPQSPAPSAKTGLDGRPQERSANAKPTITVPAGTRVALILTSPLWTKTAKPGDGVYSATTFPVTINNQMAIPPGTYVEGEIEAMTHPGGRSSSVDFQMHFTKMIFASGYAPGLEKVTGENETGKDAQPEAAVAMVYVQVSSRSDVLLDNGSQIEMTLQKPLLLDAESVAAAARLAKPPQTAQVKSATRCVPIPATPGEAPTVIPGTPGTSGTPPTVIPGGPGESPTVIPGTPGTPGTPPTVIGGSAGTPGVACPGPPIVTSGPDTHDVHTKSLQLSNSVTVAGAKLYAGNYQLRWVGLGPAAAVEFLQKGKSVARVQARVLLLDRKSLNDDTKTHANADGSISLEAVLFSGESFALSFD